MTISQFLRTLIARRRLIGITMGVMLVLLALMILIVPAKYTATASVLVSSESKDPIVGALMQTPLGESYVTTQASIIESPRVAGAVVDRLKLADDPKYQAAWKDDTDGKGDLRAWIADVITIGLKVTPGHESNVVEINYKSKYPKFSETMANAFAQAYLETSAQLKVDPVKQSAKVFDARIAENRDKLADAQKRLSDAQKAAGIVVTPERLDVENAHLNDLSTQLTLAQSQQADSTSRDRSAQGNVASSPDVLQNPVVQQLKTQVAIQEAKVRNLGTQLGPRHPAYMQAEQELADLQKSLGAETGRVGSSLQVANQIGSARVAQLQADTETQRQRIIELAQKRDQLSVLQREVDNDQKAFDLVMQRSSETSIESQVSQPDVSLLTAATEPTNPSFPKIKLFIVLTWILGFMLGIGLALLIEILDPVVHSPLDIIEQLALPVFAIVPLGAIPGRKRPRAALFQRAPKLLPAT